MDLGDDEPETLDQDQDVLNMDEPDGEDADEVDQDQDAEDGQHPAQRVPTLVIGSQLVKRGFVSTVRYTHYSLLRTVEAALGLGTLTDNDAYATPLNDVFRTRG